ncbi:hypothetical protein ACVCL0_03835 [Rhodanobacter sp. UC4450_H17]
MKKFIIVGCLAIAAMTGCATSPKPTPTSLQIQSFQTKEFETTKTIVFGSVLSVFQDLGYIVQSADKDTGFITAASPTSNKTGFWQAMVGVASSGQTKATAFVEEIRPGYVRVRLNFVNTRNNSSAYGQTQAEDTPILDPKPYQVAFEKIDDAVFVRKGALTSGQN